MVQAGNSDASVYCNDNDDDHDATAAVVNHDAAGVHYSSDVLRNVCHHIIVR